MIHPMAYSETKWIDVALRLQAIAQAGLTYTENPYDIDRYEQIREISIGIMENHSGLEESFIREVFMAEKGYPTPKVDIRAVIFRDEKILMVRERLDGRWSIPGGWADVGLSPFEIAEKETREEAGMQVKALRLLAVLDKMKHNHPPDIYHAYKLFILCKDQGGTPSPGMETLDAAFFSLNELPPLSVERNTSEQIELMFEYFHEPGKQVICD